MRTLNGYDPFECLSAVQKAIRRGQDDAALHWAYELDASNWTKALLTRLRVIAYEDIGIGDMIAVIFANQAIDVAVVEFEKGKGGHKLPVTNAVLALARASKSRIADHASFALPHRMRWNGPRPMADEAYDKHTYKGRAMGRGFKHFLQEDQLLAPKADIVDDFEADYTNELLGRDGRKPWEYKQLPYGAPYRTTKPADGVDPDDASSEAQGTFDELQTAGPKLRKRR